MPGAPASFNGSFHYVKAGPALSVADLNASLIKSVSRQSCLDGNEADLRPRL